MFLLLYISGTGEGILSYRCIFRTVVDEDSCYFNIDHKVEDVEVAPNARKRITLRVRRISFFITRKLKCHESTARLENAFMITKMFKSFKCSK